MCEQDTLTLNMEANERKRERERKFTQRLTIRRSAFFQIQLVLVEQRKDNVKKYGAVRTHIARYRQKHIQSYKITAKY